MLQSRRRDFSHCSIPISKEVDPHQFGAEQSSPEHIRSGELDDLVAAAMNSPDPIEIKIDNLV